MAISPPVQTEAANSRLLPGLALCAAIACVATALSYQQWFEKKGLTALAIAIVLGMVIGNSFYARIAPRVSTGLSFSKQTLLRAGIVLYGLRLTTQDIAQVGLAGVAIDATIVCSTFALATFAGTRWFGLDRTSAMLIGAGSAICGAAAVMATAPVVRARSEQVAVAIATVLLFGTAAIFVYPWLSECNQNWVVIRGGARGFGIYAGSTIHEVAQVAAAGRAIGPEAMGTAVIAKMVRVMLLAPFLVVLSAWLERSSARQAANSLIPMAVPWFAFGFVAVVLLNSLRLLPSQFVELMINCDSFLLAMAMAALGASARLSDIRQAGARPLLLAALLFVWLIVGGAFINRVAMAWLA